VIRKLRTFWRYLNKPMPLDEFEDYDEYWKKEVAMQPQFAEQK
jgi:hypothetical protein